MLIGAMWSVICDQDDKGLLDLRKAIQLGF
jgi:hypothetical protein